MIVALDTDGIYQATLEVLEHSLSEPGLKRRLDYIDPADLEQTRKLFPARALAPGYADRVFYLLWMCDRINAGIAFQDISADEADGIAAVQRAQAKFNHDHPPCPACGERLPARGLRLCVHCGKELS